VIFCYWIYTGYLPGNVNVTITVLDIYPIAGLFLNTMYRILDSAPAGPIQIDPIASDTTESLPDFETTDYFTEQGSEAATM
jgi:hypothetical protein